MTTTLLLVALLALTAPHAPTPKEPVAAVLAPNTPSKVLRGYILRCEQQGGVSVVTVNKQDDIVVGCARASWDSVDVPE